MSVSMRKAEVNDTAGELDRFPPEAYEPGDDINENANEILREKAKSFIAGRKWKHVDGFGLAKAS